MSWALGLSSSDGHAGTYTLHHPGTFLYAWEQRLTNVGATLRFNLSRGRERGVALSTYSCEDGGGCLSHAQSVRG